MIMHWREFLDTADRLAQGKTEGDWRSAVSRAYYAVLHYFREFFQGYGLNVGRAGQVHFNLYVGLLHCGFAPVAILAGDVDRPRRLRGEADYELGKQVTGLGATSALQDARTLVADFQALLGTVPAAQIAAGVRAHLRSIGRIV
jgi:uncharacterized protein (UPF0332 family)